MKLKKKAPVLPLLGLFLFFNPAPAHADAGVPMIVLTFPAMLTALIPIILIEAAVFSKLLKINYKSALLPSFSANAVSTLAGFPLSWLLLFGIELLTTGGGTALGISTFLGKIAAVTLQAAWLIPYESELGWMVPMAAAVGLVPAYFISLWIELRIVEKFFKDRNKNELKQAVQKANLITYGFLAALCLTVFAYQSAVRRRWITLTPEDKTIVEATKRIESNPNDYLAYYKRGLAYAKLEGSAKAIPDFDKAIAINPKDALVYIARGNAYRHGFYRYKPLEGRDLSKGMPDNLEKDMNQAVSDYDQALKIDPRSSSAYAHRGNAYWKWKKLDQAAADLNKALEFDPKNADACFDLGDMAAEKKDFDQAVSRYSRILAFDPANFKARAKRGAAYDKKGDFDQAIDDFNKALELKPKDGDLYLLRAGAYYGKKEYKKSWGDVRKAQSLGSDPALIRLEMDYGFKGYEFFEKLKRDSS